MTKETKHAVTCQCHECVSFDEFIDNNILQSDLFPPEVKEKVKKLLPEVKKKTTLKEHK